MKQYKKLIYNICIMDSIKTGKTYNLNSSKKTNCFLNTNKSNLINYNSNRFLSKNKITNSIDNNTDKKINKSDIHSKINKSEKNNLKMETNKNDDSKSPIYSVTLKELTEKDSYINIESSKNLSIVSLDGNQYHILYDKWTLYAHLPHDTDWSIDSYKSLMTIQTLEEGIAIIETLPEIMIKNCMLFLMRKDIKPIWEDEKNRKGGCFSYKVSNKNVFRAWKNLCYLMFGETISKNNDFLSCVNGITISPKKNFCIIKIWMKNCNNQNISYIENVGGLDKHGVLFKKHKPEY